MRACFCLKILSTDGIVQFGSPQGLALLELDAPEPITGRHYAQLWPLQWRSPVADAYRDAANGRIATIEGYLPTFKERPKWWDSSFYLVRGQDVEPHIIGISHDISAYRSLRLQLAIDDAAADSTDLPGQSV